MVDLGVSDEEGGIDGFAFPHFICALRNGFSGISDLGKSQEFLTLQLQYYTYQTHALGASIQVLICSISVKLGKTNIY